jgi:hypothetical protein
MAGIRGLSLSKAHVRLLIPTGVSIDKLSVFSLISGKV